MARVLPGQQPLFKWQLEGCHLLLYQTTGAHSDRVETEHFCMVTCCETNMKKKGIFLGVKKKRLVTHLCKLLAA